MVTTVNGFRRYDNRPRVCNATFITLIPKTENSQELKEYMSLSVVGCL